MYHKAQGLSSREDREINPKELNSADFKGKN